MGTMRSTKAESASQLQSKIGDNLNPIPINNNEKITKPETEKGDVKLVQQYIMVRGKL